MKYIMVILSAIVLTACSIKEPRISVGKKCAVKEDKVVYSYVWLYDKEGGLEANEETCKKID